MKGRTIIELTDINTKEVKRIEDNNMFTKALDAVFKQFPWWHSNNSVARSESDITSLVPVVGNALGGLLLFPEEIEENENLLYAPASNKPTAIASYDAYSGEDSRRGSFNDIESGKIANGYRFVWDFPTSAGNGPIKCACLTSKKGGAGYWNAGGDLIKDNNSGAYYEPIGARYTLWNGLSECYAFGADEKGIYYKTGSDIYRIRTPRKSYTLFGSPYTSDKLGTLTNNGGMLLHEGKVCVIRNGANSSGNATVTIDKYDPETWEMTSEVITVAAPLAASNELRHTCVTDGYLYLLGNDTSRYYKVNLENLADVQEIVTNGGNDTGRSGSLASFNHGAISHSRLIEADNTSHDIALTNSVPFASDGVWLMCGVERAGGGSRLFMTTGSTVVMPYIATINNLAQPVNKGATQTMKVTYIVTE
ncbi:MAG: hypothetical protein MJ007_02845 [Paludibacteraceae bacterium]|nr:hypothetical protein [Paludibacteraceae bacterium]